MILELRDRCEALDFLRSEEYEKAIISDSRVPRLSYVDGSGSGFWEDIAGYFGWVREEPGDCCMYWLGKEGVRTWCPKCGVGLNGLSTWKKVDLSSDLIAYFDGIYG